MSSDRRRAAGGLAALAVAALLTAGGRVGPAAAYSETYLTVIPFAYQPAGNGVITTRDGVIHCVVSFGMTTGMCRETWINLSPPYPVVVYDVAADADSIGYDDLTGTFAATFSGSLTIDRITDLDWYGFERLKAHLTVKPAGAGSGTIAGTNGLDCGTTCTTLVDLNAAVTLTAAAAPGSTFHGWTPGPCLGSGPTCTFQIQQNLIVTATFDMATPGPSVAPSIGATPGPSAPAATRQPTQSPAQSAGSRAQPTGATTTSTAAATAGPVATTGDPVAGDPAAGAPSPGAGASLARPVAGVQPIESGQPAMASPPGADADPRPLMAAIVIAGLVAGGLIAGAILLSGRRRPA